MRRFSRFLSDFLLLSAICTFLFSVLSPFLIAIYRIEPEGSKIHGFFRCTYWSYKGSLDGMKPFLTSWWFYGITLNGYPFYLGISWILVAIFLLQVLTLASGIFSLLKTRIIRIVPLVSSIITLFLMVQIYVKARDMELAIVSLGWGEYQPGYWLIYPCIFLFYFAFIFHLYSSREKTTQTHTIH